MNVSCQIYPSTFTSSETKGAASTLISHSAETLPTFAVIVTVPCAIAKTTPSSTVATSILLDSQTISVSVAFSGSIVATRVSVFPTVSVSLVWFNVILSAAITSDDESVDESVSESVDESVSVSVAESVSPESSV